MRWRSLISSVLVFVLVAGDVFPRLSLRHSSFLAPSSKTFNPTELQEFRRLCQSLEAKKLGTESKPLLELFPDLNKKIKQYSQFLKEERSLNLLLLLEEELKELDPAMQEVAGEAFDQLLDEMAGLFEQHGGELQQVLGACVAQFHREYRETFGKKHPVTLRDLTWWAKFIRKQSPQMGLGKAVVIGAKYIYAKRLKSKEDQDQFWTLLQKLKADAKFAALFAEVDLPSLRELPKGEESKLSDFISGTVTLRDYIETRYKGVEAILDEKNRKIWNEMGVAVGPNKFSVEVIKDWITFSRTLSDQEFENVLFAEWRAYADSVNDLHGGMFAATKLGEIAKFLSEIGEKDKARAIFEEAVQKAKTLPSPVKDVLLEAISKFLAEVGEFEEALKASDFIDIKETNFKGGAQTQIVKSLAEKGKFEEALKVSASIEKGRYKAIAKKEVVKFLAKAGRFEEALQTSDSIEEELDEKAEALTEIAKALANKGKKNRSAKIFKEVLQLAASVTTINEETAILKKVAKALAESGEKGKAKEVLKEVVKEDSEVIKSIIIDETIPESTQRFRIGQILTSWIEIGGTKEALQVANSITDQFQKGYFLKEIAAFLTERGDLEAAVKVANSIEGAWKSSALSRIDTPRLLFEREESIKSLKKNLVSSQAMILKLIQKNEKSFEQAINGTVQGSYQAAVRDEGEVLVVGQARVGKNKELLGKWEEVQDDASGVEAFNKKYPYFTAPGSRKLVMSKTTAEIAEQVGFCAMSGEPLMLSGPTGVGKSAGVKWVAAQTGHEHLCVGITPAVTKEDLIGGWRPATRNDEGAIIQWQEGPLLHAVKTGKWITLEEFNLAPTEVIEMLNYLLVHGKLAYVDEYGEMRYQKAHPEFRIIVTQNPTSYAQRQKQSEPLLARFVKMEVGELSREELGEIVGATTELPGAMLSKIVEIHDEIDKQSKPRSTKDTQVYGKGEKEKYEFDLRTLTRVAQRITEELDKKGAKEALVIARAFWSEYGSALRSEADRAAFFIQLDAQLELQKNNISQDDLEPVEVKISLEDNKLIFTATYINRDVATVTLQIGAEAGENLPFVGDEGLIPESAGTRKELFRIAEALSRGEDLLLVGETGAGKTSRIQYLMMLLGKPFWYKNLDSDTAIEELIGEDYPAGLDKDGRPRFERRDGILIRAMERGEPLFLDELNLSALPEWLTTVLDERKLILPGRIVVAKSGFQVIGAMNRPKEEGRHVLSPAMKSRFREIWMLEPSGVAELSEIAEFYLKETKNQSLAQLIATFHEAYKETFGKKYPVTLRDLTWWAKFIRKQSPQMGLGKAVVIGAKYIYSKRLKTKEDQDQFWSLLQKLKEEQKFAALFAGVDLPSLRELPKGGDAAANEAIVGEITFKKYLELSFAGIEKIEGIFAEYWAWLLEGIESEEWEVKIEAFMSLFQIAKKMGDAESAKQALDEALRVAKTISDEKLKSEALKGIAQSLSLAGEKDWANELFNEALKVAETISHKGSKSEALKGIARSLSVAGEKLKDNELFNEALRVAKTISDERLKSEALKGIAQSLALAGEKLKDNELFKKALEVAKTISDEWLKSEALSEIAQSLALAGEKKWDNELFKKALEVAETIYVEYYKLPALKGIAQSLSLAGEKDWANEFFNEALRVAKTISDEKLKSEALKGIAQSLALAGEKDWANKLFKKALKVAETISYNGSKSEALKGIAQSLALAGEKKWANELFKKALEVAETIYVEGLKSEALKGIAQSLALAGEKDWANELFKKALEVAKTISDEWLKSQALNNINISKIHLAIKTLLEEIDEEKITKIKELVAQNQKAIEAHANAIVQGSYQAAVRDEEDALVVGQARVGKNKELLAEWKEAQANKKSKAKFLAEHPHFTPPLSRKLVMSKTTAEIAEQVGFCAMSGEPLMLSGPTGVGKSAVVKWVAAQTGHEHLCVGITPAVTKEDLIGGWRPAARNDEGAIIQWQEGPLLHAVKRGKWITLEEFNLAPTEVIEMLNYLLVHGKLAYVDERGMMRYQKAHPEFRIVVTQNPGSYNQRQKQSEPLLARFVKMEVAELSREELGEIVGATTQLPGTIVSKIVEIHDEIDKQSKPRSSKDTQVYGQGEKEKYEFDLRTLARVAQRIKEELDKKGAKEAVVLARVFWSEYGSALRSEADRAAFFTLLDSQLELQKNKISRIDLEPIEVEIKKEQSKLIFTAKYKNGDVATVTLPIGAEAGENLPFVGDEGLIPESAGTRKELFRIAEALSRGEDLLLVGETGAGKTSRIQYLMMLLGKPFWYKNLDSDTAIEELIGEDYPAGLDKYGRPRFERRDGILIRAMERGEPLFLDELNLSALPEWLTTVLDERKLILPGRVVIAKAGFQIIGAMNPPRVEGRHQLSPAMKSRFREIWMPEPSGVAELSEIAEFYLDQTENKSLAVLIATFHEAYKETFGKKYPLTLRDLTWWAKFIRKQSPQMGLGKAVVIGAKYIYSKRLKTKEDQDQFWSLLQKLKEDAKFAALFADVDLPSLRELPKGEGAAATELITGEMTFKKYVALSSKGIEKIEGIDVEDWQCLLEGMEFEVPEIRIKALLSFYRAVESHALFKSQAIAEALEVARSLKESLDKSGTLSMIAAAMAAVGEKKAAKKVFAEALEVARSLKESLDKSGTLSMIAAAMAAVGEKEEAKVVFSEALVEARLIWDPGLQSQELREISTELAAIGEKKAAKKVFSEALKVARLITFPREKTRALRAFAAMFALDGEKEAAKEFFSEALEAARLIESSVEKSDELRKLIAALAAAGEKGEAKKVFSEALKVALLTGRWSRDQVLSVLATVLSVAGEKEAAKEFFSEALEAARLTKDPSEKSDKLRKLIAALVVAGEKEAAKKVFSEALEVALLIEASFERSEVLKEISAAAAVAGKKKKEFFSEAVEVARLISFGRFKSEALREIAAALVVAGEKEAAKEVLAEALEAVRFVGGSGSRREELRAITEAKIDVAEKGLLAAVRKPAIGAAIKELVRCNLAEIEAQANQAVSGSYQAAVRDKGDVLVVGEARVGKNQALLAEWEEVQDDASGVEAFNKKHPYFTPPASRKLVMSKTTAEIAEQVGFCAMSGEPLMLSGPTGVGKSAVVKWLAAQTGHEHLCVGITPAVTKEDLIGGWRPAARNDEGAIIQWQEGPLLHAVKTGKWITLEEFNLAPTEVIEMLNYLLVHGKLAYVDERGEMRYQKAHPEFRIFVTQNPLSYQQRQKQSEPLLARFVKMEVGELSREELGEIVGATTQLPGAIISKIVEIHDKIDKHSKPRSSKDTQVYGKEEKEKYEFDLRTLTRVAQRIAEELKKQRDPSPSAQDDTGKKAQDEKEALVMARAFWSEYGSALRSEADRAAFFTLLDAQLGLQKNKISRDDLEPIEVEIKKEKTKLIFTAKYQDGKTRTVTLTIGSEAGENLPFVGDEGLIPESAGTRKELFRIAEALSRGEDLLLVGETGAGKTSRIQYLMMLLGKPFWYKNLDSDTAIEELIGEDYPAGLDKYGRPRFERRDGILIRAMERGEPLFLDELNLSALPEWLTTVLDERKLILPDRIVVAKSGFQVIGAMNRPKEEGRHVLSPAMKSRFREIWMEEPKEEQELTEIAAAYFNGVGEKLFNGGKSWWRVLMRSSHETGLGLGRLAQSSESPRPLTPLVKENWRRGLTPFFTEGVHLNALFNALRGTGSLFRALDASLPDEESPRKKAIHEMSLDELFDEIAKHDPRFQDPRFRAHLREQVKIKQTQIETIGLAMGGDTTVKFRPGPGWAYDFDANAILYPLHELLEKEAEELIGVSFHEGSHRDVSRLDIEEAIFGFFFSNETLRLLLNAVEDPRVNNWAEMKYPGAIPYLKKLYDEEFPENIQEKRDVMRQLAAEVGMKTEDGAMQILPHMEYALSLIYFWARLKDQQRQAEEKKETLNLEAAVEIAKEKTLTHFATHEAVKQAIEKTYKSFAPLFHNYLPPNPRDKEGRLNLPGEAKKWELAIGLAEAVKKELLPEYEKLIELSKEQIKEMIRQGKCKMCQGGSGQGAGQPIDPSLLDEEARKMLEENSRKGADKLDGKMDYPKRDEAKERSRRAREKEKAASDKEKKEGQEKPQDESFLAKRLREQREREEREKDLQTTHSRYYAPVARLIEDLAGRLGNLFWPNSHPRDVGYFFTGKKLSVKKVAQSERHGWSSIDDWKLFTRRKIPTKRDYKFTIVLDQSGSMTGEKGEKAINASLLFMHVLSHLGIEFNVVGFSDGVSFHRENFSSEFEQNSALQEELTRAIDRSMGSGMTNDGAAMRAAVEKMRVQMGDRRVIIVLTDGEGNMEPLDPELAKAEAAGIEVIAIGIGEGIRYVQNSYKKHVLVPNLDELPEAFARILEEQLMAGGALADEVQLRRNRFVGMPGAQLAPFSLWLASRLVDPTLGIVAGSFVLGYYVYHLIQGSLKLATRQKIAHLKAQILSQRRNPSPMAQDDAFGVKQLELVETSL